MTNGQGHDYSRHAIHELEDEVSSLDPSRHPERARSLQEELLRRLHEASAMAAEAATSKALSVGARFSQLDRGAARRFFWPFLGYNFLFSFLAGVVVGFIASFVEGIFAAFGVGAPGSLAGRAIRLVVTLLLAFPVASLWLRTFTKHSFGGYGLKLVTPGSPPQA